MDWWEDDFCELLAGGARFVIRYDHRDTGQSTPYPPGAPGYTAATWPTTFSACSTTSASPAPTSSGCRWAALSPS